MAGIILLFSATDDISSSLFWDFWLIFCLWPQNIPNNKCYIATWGRKWNDLTWEPQNPWEVGLRKLECFREVSIEFYFITVLLCGIHRSYPCRKECLFCGEELCTHLSFPASNITYFLYCKLSYAGLKMCMNLVILIDLNNQALADPPPDELVRPL